MVDFLPGVAPQATEFAADVPDVLSGPPALAGNWTLIFEDTFTGTSLDTTKWSDKDDYQAAPGYHDGGNSWVAIPATNAQREVANGILTLKARFASGLPDGAIFTSAELNTDGLFAVPAGTTYVEGRLWMSSARGMHHAFWMMGSGQWPITGEVDFVEFSNNLLERGSPYSSVHFPLDVYTSPPGTFLNDGNVSHPDSYPTRNDLFNSWHTYGCLRTSTKIEFYIDGVLSCRFNVGATYPTSYGNARDIPLPEVLFTEPMHLRLHIRPADVWGSQGLTTDQFQEGDMRVDYIRVWYDGVYTPPIINLLASPTWGANGATLTEGQADTSSGTTATIIAETTDSGTSGRYVTTDSTTSTATGTYHFEGKFKASGHDWILVQIAGSTGYLQQWVDLGSGVLGSLNASIFDVSLNTLTAVADNAGWYKLVIEFAKNATPSLTTTISLETGDFGGSVYVGTAPNGVLYDDLTLYVVS